MINPIAKSDQITDAFQALNFDREWSFSNRKYESYSHNYHRYPAKFTGPLANKLIREESVAGDFVCDIFGGCGTTLVEAKLLGRASLGFDINPVAKLITEVKTSAISPAKLSTAYQQLREQLDKKPDLSQVYTDTHERLQYWFSQKSYNSLNHIYDAILREEDESIQKFFLCAFSHCLKNSSRWLMKSIKPTIDRNKKNTDTVKIFLMHLCGMIKKNAIFYARLQKQKNLTLGSKIYRADIVNTSRRHRYGSQIDLVITSPPYVTSYEYGDLHQLTLLWLAEKHYKGWQKYIKNFGSFKRAFIGSSMINDQTPGNLHSYIAEKTVVQLAAKDRGLSKKVAVYFSKMYRSFEVIHYLLREGKKACIVIGNTKLKGVDILNAEATLEQLLSIGFRKDSIIKRNANTNKMVAPYRDKKTGKFTSKNNSNKTVAYHEEYILKVKK